MKSRTMEILRRWLTHPPERWAGIARQLDACENPARWETLHVELAREIGRALLEARLAQADPPPGTCPKCARSIRPRAAGHGQDASQGSHGAGLDGARSRGSRASGRVLLPAAQDLFRPRRRASRLMSSLLGEVRLTRRLWRCAACGAEHAPLDRALELNGVMSAGTVAACAWLLAEMPIRRARQLLARLCGIRLGAATVHRLSRRQGSPAARPARKRGPPADRK